jgi:tetratricopeptide (TPR) repeat protein
MRYITRIVLVMLIGMLCKPGIAVPMPQQNTSKPSVESMSVSELETLGDAARARKDYGQAIRYFEAALRKERKNARIYNKLGLAELKNDDQGAAKQDFAKAFKYNPQSADAVNNLGAIDYMQHRYGPATKYFKKAVALDEARASFHINLGAAWFGQKKMDRAVAEYRRALELDPEAFQQESKAGITALISPEERAQWAYMMAKIYAQQGDTEGCLRCLKKAKEGGYRDMARVYKDEEFSKLRDDVRLHEIVPPPVAK